MKNVKVSKLVKKFFKVKNKKVQVCTQCVYDERVPQITFNSKGICNYCNLINKLKKQYGTNTNEGKSKLNKLINEIKKNGKSKKYDCIVGVSGGTDSSYLLYLCKKWNLRVLAVHYDNTWNSSIASENIRKVLQALNIDLFTLVIDNKESDDIFKSFFLAGVPEIDAATDLGFTETLYRAASKYKIKYVLEGHSFLTEGITPLGKNYFDGKYISSIHNKFGKRKLVTYPLMTFWRFMWWICIKKIKRIRPYWYLSISKEKMRMVLEKKFNWQYYGGHHLENRMTSFFHSIYSPQKFKVDYRNNTLSAKVRNGDIKRNDAWKEYNTKPFVEEELLTYFKKRLKLSDKEYNSVMNKDPLYWYNYPTYKRLFEILKPFFFICVKTNLVPESFYIKYCFEKKKKI